MRATAASTERNGLEDEEKSMFAGTRQGEDMYWKIGEAIHPSIDPSPFLHRRAKTLITRIPDVLRFGLRDGLCFFPSLHPPLSLLSDWQAHQKPRAKHLHLLG